MLDTRASQTNNHHYVRISFPLSAQIRKAVESGNMVIDIEILAAKLFLAKMVHNGRRRAKLSPCLSRSRYSVRHQRQ